MQTLCKCIEDMQMDVTMYEVECVMQMYVGMQMWTRT